MKEKADLKMLRHFQRLFSISLVKTAKKDFKILLDTFCEKFPVQSKSEFKMNKIMGSRGIKKKSKTKWFCTT